MNVEEQLAAFERQIELVERGIAEPETLDIMGTPGLTLFMRLSLEKFKLFEKAINRLAERLDRLEAKTLDDGGLGL